jgi:hypothetical protein
MPKFSLLQQSPVIIRDGFVINMLQPCDEYNHAGYVVVYLQGSDKTLTLPTSVYSSGQHLSVDIVASPTTCADTPDQASQFGRRRLNNAAAKDSMDLASSGVITKDLPEGSMKKKSIG